MKLILCLIAVAHVVVAKSLTNEEVCRRSDSDLNKCLLDKSEKTIKQLAEGVLSYKMEPLEPYQLDFMILESNIEQLKLKMAMTNITVHGFGDTKLQIIKFDPETLTGELTCSAPLLIMTCDYLATGKLFAIPLESNAHYYGNFSDVSFSFQFKFKTVQRKGVEYFSVEKFTSKIGGDNFYMKLESIDPARQPQVQRIQDFCNENVDLIIKTTKPMINEYAGPFYQHMFERYLRRIPANELLPY